ncbi:hypothetical protein [Paenibacillus sp. SI8]|uniref:hypothetical protein n=1 Tax=unclassified Paenibacillus TaxID=185978 RepID=UPI00346629DD
MTLERGINPETGEVGTFVPNGKGYVIRSREQIEASQRYFEAQRAVFSGRAYDFTFSVMDALHEVTSVLTKAQCGYLLLLQCYVSYGTGRLINADRSPMTTDDMRKALRMDDRRKKSSFYDFLCKCVSGGILIANSDGSHSVNDRYHFRGSTPTGLSVIKSYTAKIKRIYGGVKPEDLGLIYRMLPLVHYASNTLCTNPGEKIPEKVAALNRAELAAVIGISVGEISRRLPKMTVDGEYVIAKVAIGGVESYMFNPWIFYRKMSVPDETLRTIFRVKAS